MSWAWHDTKQLRAREDKVEDLWDEEEDKGFGEMALQCNSSESHACEVAECVPGKCFRRIPMFSGIPVKLTSCAIEIHRIHLREGP